MQYAEVTYGDRFRQLRVKLWKGRGKTVLELAKKLGAGYNATVYNIEKSWRPPELPTIQRHAEALGCMPWELLVDVETEYDLAKQLATMNRDKAEEGWRSLLQRYQQSASRSTGRMRRAPDARPVKRGRR